MNDKTILLVEDNRDDEALDDLHGNGNALPALMLVDLKLPKVDGLAVLRRIRAEARPRLLPVAILTTSKEEQDLINPCQIGANNCVRRPVDCERFSAAVRQLGLYWRLLNGSPPHRGVR
jgi:DNA-binding response OmpR family regulator